jgi:class 3 adenylate cyclase
LQAAFFVGFGAILAALYARSADEVLWRRFLVAEHATRAQGRTAALLNDLLPPGVPADLLLRGETVVEELDGVSLLYSDLKGFTELSSKLSPEALIRLLDAL